MTNELPTEQRVELLESLIAALETRLDGLTARIEWMQIQQAERQPTLTTEQVWATPPRPRFRFLNGSWPMRDGNTYPPVRGKGPIGGYESYVRRSPPATE